MAQRGVLRTVEGGSVLFWCPGCKTHHQVRIESHPNLPGPIWGFNDDYDRPTFTPSVLVRRTIATPPVTPENLDEWREKPWPQTDVLEVCHTFVTDGQIQFLGDCTHELAGQTVPLTMPNFERTDHVE